MEEETMFLKSSYKLGEPLICTAVTETMEDKISLFVFFIKSWIFD